MYWRSGPTSCIRESVGGTKASKPRCHPLPFRSLFGRWNDRWVEISPGSLKYWKSKVDRQSGVPARGASRIPVGAELTYEGAASGRFLFAIRPRGAKVASSDIIYATSSEKSRQEWHAAVREAAAPPHQPAGRSGGGSAAPAQEPAAGAALFSPESFRSVDSPRDSDARSGPAGSADAFASSSAAGPSPGEDTPAPPISTLNLSAAASEEGLDSWVQVDGPGGSGGTGRWAGDTPVAGAPSADMAAQSAAPDPTVGAGERVSDASQPPTAAPHAPDSLVVPVSEAVQVESPAVPLAGSVGDADPVADSIASLGNVLDADANAAAAIAEAPSVAEAPPAAVPSCAVEAASAHETPSALATAEPNFGHLATLVADEAAASGPSTAPPQTSPSPVAEEPSGAAGLQALRLPAPPPETSVVPAAVLSLGICEGGANVDAAPAGAPSDSGDDDLDTETFAHSTAAAGTTADQAGELHDIAPVTTDVTATFSSAILQGAEAAALPPDAATADALGLAEQLPVGEGGDTGSNSVAEMPIEEASVEADDTDDVSARDAEADWQQEAGTTTSHPSAGTLAGKEPAADSSELPPQHAPDSAASAVLPELAAATCDSAPMVSARVSSEELGDQQNDQAGPAGEPTATKALSTPAYSGTAASSSKAPASGSLALYAALAAAVALLLALLVAALR